MKPLLTGLDTVAAEAGRLRGKRVALVANPASVTSRFVPALDALLAADVDVRAVWGPEHGAAGAAQDMEAVADGGAGSIPVVSLYGDSFDDLSPKPELFRGIDAVVCDLPDVGSRYYTFVWTTALVMRAAAMRRVPVWVLDRPNPLGGLVVEGNLPEPPLLSFVGLYPVPVRHGLTPGEMALYVNAVHGLECELTVVPLREGTGLAARSRIGECPAWVLPSPNMPSAETALLYPGGCLVEGTNLSEGRGTTRPFHFVGAAWLSPGAAADAANALGLPGVAFRPHAFRPMFQKHAGVLCGGVEVHVLEPASFQPYATYLHLLKALRDLDPASFRWRTERYEYRDDVPAIDLLTGTARYRSLVDAGEPLAPWLATFARDEAAFRGQREPHLLYPPERKRPGVLLFVGAHESGKTTLLVKVIERLAAEGLRVGTVKHTDHEYETDAVGKDSQRHAEAGANPALLVAGGRTALHARHTRKPGLEEVLSRGFEGCDLVLVEGYKRAPYPKVEVCRAATGRPTVLGDDPELVAVVTDTETPHPAGVPRLAFDNLDGLVAATKKALGLTR
ncbi:MAG: molybdopterin-guanine dinucleotide biosynthesis protein B [Acidobacteria bacterium]|nr:molybdopterin-guanine dinucleotide biosynthesis protein B [Acidobacteriota bacterium]